MSAATTGRLTRVSILLQVFLVVLLAAGAAAIVTWLSSRPGLWARWDVTVTKRNTLDTQLARVLERVPRKVTVETFFRPLEKPLDTVGYEAQGRMSELLHVAVGQMPDKIAVIDHDLSDLGKVSARMQELGVEEPNVVVLSDGQRKVVLRLFRDIARIDPGNPRMKVPPRMGAFLGDQAFGDALLRLAIDRTPKVLFSTGHGERDPYSTEIRQLGGLQSALTVDGFVTGLWESSDDPHVPQDCDVLVVLDPKQPFSGPEIEGLHAFARRGGRFLISPSLDRGALGGPGSMAEFLAEYGILVQAGLVANPITDALGNPREGDSRCSMLFIGPEGMDRKHPVTESLWSMQRRVVLPQSRCFMRGTAPENGVLLDLLRSSPKSWLDLPNSSGLHDWRWNRKLEAGGSFILAMAAALQAPEGSASAELAELGADERPATRIVALGSPDALGNGEGGVDPIDINRDLALNMFNWLAERDHRLVVRPRTVERRVVDLQRGGAQKLINRVTTLLIPGLCLLLGMIVWWRRRR